MENKLLPFLNIQEFHPIVSRYGLRLNFPFFKKASKTPSIRLYKGIVSGEIKDDEDAIQMLYTGVNTETRKKYHKTKNRLRKKLLNGVLFLNLRPETNSRSTIIFADLQKRLASIRILLRLGGERTALSEAKRGLILAERYDFPQLALEFGNIIQSHYSKTGQVTEYLNFNKKITALQSRYIGEQEVLRAVQRFTIYYARRRSNLPKTYQILDESLGIVTTQLSLTNSLTISFNYYKLLIFKYQMEADFVQAYNIGEEGLNYLAENKKKAANDHFGTIYLQQVINCIYSANKTNGIEAYKKGLPYHQKGTWNWFVFAEAAFMFYMHSDRIEEAKQIFFEAYNDDSYKLLDETQKQRWDILNLYFLFMTSELKLALSTRSKRSRELRDLIKSVGNLRHDKPGFGFDLRLMYILLLVEQGDYAKLTENVDALKKYCFRYFPAKYYRRSRVFMNLLLLLAAHSFNHIVIEKKSKKQFQKLLNTPVSFLEASENLQVVPYEEIWKKIMDKLYIDREKIAKMIVAGKFREKTSLRLV